MITESAVAAVRAKLSGGSASIFLVGPMGAGKTTVGLLLARLFKRPFLDSDREIERHANVDIPTIFDYEGESGFRRREQAMLEQLTLRSGIILATGGGCVVTAANLELLRSRGVVIYLHASVTMQYQRIGASKHRPMIADTAGSRQRLEALMAQREPLYRSIADIVVCAEKKRTVAVAHALHERLQTLNQVAS